MLEALRAKLPPNPVVHALYAGEDHAAGLIGPVLVMLARREPDAAHLPESDRWFGELLARYPKKGGYIVVVQASAPPPSEPARKVIDKAYTQYGRGAQIGAMVIEGKGFMAASIRSALSLLMLKSRYGYPLKIFATVAEGAAFVCPALPPEYGAARGQVVTGVEELRRAYEGHFGPLAATKQ